MSRFGADSGDDSLNEVSARAARVWHLLTRENTIISLVHNYVDGVYGQQYESGSNLDVLHPSHHAFVSRMTANNRWRLKSWVLTLDVDMSLSTVEFPENWYHQLDFGFPTTAPPNPFGASSGTEAAVADIPPGILVLIIPTSLQFCMRFEAHQSIPWKAGLKPRLQLLLDRCPFVLSNDSSAVFGSGCYGDPQ
jgi:hypothetical protein